MYVVFVFVQLKNDYREGGRKQAESHVKFWQGMM